MKRMMVFFLCSMFVPMILQTQVSHANPNKKPEPVRPELPLNFPSHTAPPQKPSLPPPPIHPQTPQVTPTFPAPSAGALQKFRNDEQDAIAWNQRFEAAASHSFDERYAAKMRELAIKAAIADLQDPRSFATMNSQNVLDLAMEMNDKFECSDRGSAMEQFYSVATRLVYSYFNQVLMVEVKQLAGDWREMVAITLDFDSRFESAPTGSYLAKSYDQARRYLYGCLAEVVRRDLMNHHKFTSIEQVGIYFNTQYEKAGSGSLRESVMMQIRNMVLTTAVEMFRVQAGECPEKILYQIQADYDQKFCSAGAGTALEVYYAQIRDIARSYLLPSKF